MCVTLQSHAVVLSLTESWSQGQCGSGAALEDIARQQRQEWDRMVHADRPQPMSASHPQGFSR